MPDILEEVLNTANVMAPIWNDDVWGALQGRRFDVAETYLRDRLSKMSAQEWGSVYWMGIVSGIPAFRGDIDPETWAGLALPKIGGAVIMAASPIKISAAYSSINGGELATFHNFILSAIPETAADKKLAWIKTNQSPLLNFFLANPLGLHLTAPLDFLTKQSLARLKTLPENLKAALFSAQTAEVVKKVCEQNNVPENKISAVAGTTGLALLGFIHPEELAWEISGRTGLAQPIGKIISDSLNNRIFAPLRETIDNVYAPLPHEEPGAVSKIMEEIKKPGVQPAKQEIDVAKIFGMGPIAARSQAISRAELSVSPVRAPIIPRTDATESSPEPAPTMLHEEAATKPLRAASGFSIDVPINLSDSSVKVAPPSPRPAILEFGANLPKPEIKNLPEPPKAPRVVHYAEFRTPLEKAAVPASPVKSKIDSAKEPTAPTMPSPPPTPPTAATPSPTPPRPRIEPPEIRR